MIGIIANPSSGKDIRRLVAQGTVFDNMEKVNIVQRILVALYHTGIKDVYAMPDAFQIVPKAAEMLKRNFQIGVGIKQLDIEFNYDQNDSTRAAAMLNKMGASCIITLGGDGTNRAVAKASGDVPLIPLSTGTNNVFPKMLEGTVAGLTAAVAEIDKDRKFVSIDKRKSLKIYKNSRMVELALIDAVITEDMFTGSRAIWDPESIREIIVTQASADSIGMSAIAGSFCPISEVAPQGLYLELDSKGSFKTWAAIAPGVIRRIGIKECKNITFGQRICIKTKTGIVALDGEREVSFDEKDQIFIELSKHGPKIINIKETLNSAAKGGFFEGRYFYAESKLAAKVNNLKRSESNNN